MKTKKYLNNDTIYVELYYRKRGVTLAGEHRPGGYVFHIQPCEVKNGIVAVSFSDGRSVLLAEVGRRSDKKQAALWAAIEPHAQTIADLFSAGQWGMIPPYIHEKVLCNT